MRSANDRTNRRRASARGILFYAVAGLLILTMLSTWLVCGMFAKYTTAGSDLDAARVAKGLQLQLLEHKAVLVNGQYYLKNGENKDIKEADGVEEVITNNYEKVIPGVDIPKDPFVRLSGTSEVDYWLYVQITEENFPERDAKTKFRTVDYKVTDEWELVEENEENGVYVYKYKFILDSGKFVKGDDIPILQKNKHGCELTVSQYYKGTDADGEVQNFSLTFKAWIVQAD